MVRELIANRYIQKNDNNQIVKSKL